MIKINTITKAAEKDLFNELSQLIEQSQQQVVSQANSTLTMLFWHIGNRINKEIFKINGQTMENELCRQCRHNWKNGLEGTLRRKM